jgi:hypothetical protein
MRTGKTSFAVSGVSAGFRKEQGAKVKQCFQQPEILWVQLNLLVGASQQYHLIVSLKSAYTWAQRVAIPKAKAFDPNQLRLLGQRKSSCTIIAAQRFFLRGHCCKTAIAGIPAFIRFSYSA